VCCLCVQCLRCVDFGCAICVCCMFDCVIFMSLCCLFVFCVGLRCGFVKFCVCFARVCDMCMVFVCVVCVV